jgi:hypothetical protein
VSPAPADRPALLEALRAMCDPGGDRPTPNRTEPTEREPPMSEIRPDLDRALANVAKTFAQKGRLCRQRAAEQLAAMDRQLAMMVDPPKDEAEWARQGFRWEADRANAEAELWEARAAEAEAGYFLCRVSEELNDGAFIQEFGDVMSVAQSQDRAVYRSTIQDQRMQQGLAGAESV